MTEKENTDKPIDGLGVAQIYRLQIVQTPPPHLDNFWHFVK